MLLVIPLLCGCAPDVTPALGGLTGRWEGTATLEIDGEVLVTEIVLVLTEIDAQITGICECSGGLCGSGVRVSGIYEDDTTVSIVGILPGGVLLLEGAVAGDTISGTCAHRGATHPWQVTRVD